MTDHAQEEIERPLKDMLERQGISVVDVLKSYVDGTKEAISIIEQKKG